nr:MAG TPA: hypothetical protein [Caudoviricetes sp.]
MYITLTDSPHLYTWGLNSHYKFTSCSKHFIKM